MNPYLSTDLMYYVLLFGEGFFYCFHCADKICFFVSKLIKIIVPDEIYLTEVALAEEF